MDLILLILGTYYLQHILRWEAGPFGVFDTVREAVFGVRIDEDPNQGAVALPVRPGVLAELISCIFCFSFWAGCLLMALWQLWPPLIWPFAIAGGVVVASSIAGGRHGNR